MKNLKKIKCLYKIKIKILTLNLLFYYEKKNF